VRPAPAELPKVDGEVPGRLQREGCWRRRGWNEPARRPLGLEELPEIGQGDAQVAGATGGVVLGPEDLGHGVARERAVDDEQGQKGAHAGAAQLRGGRRDAVEGHDEGAEDRDLEPSPRHRRQAGQQVGGGPTEGARLAGQEPQLGARRLGHLDDQPLGQPEAARVTGGVQPGGQLDRPRQRERGEDPRRVEPGGIGPAPGAAPPANGRPPICSWVGPIAVVPHRRRVSGSST
jgi:hypothetical protein